MLVAMTFNVGLFISVVAGLAIGSAALGHWMEGEYVWDARGMDQS
jgi:hypothetical protein